MAGAEPHARAALLIAGARACLGAGFRPYGRGPDVFDCVGVALAAAAAAGLNLTPPAMDWRCAEAARVRDWMREAGFAERVGRDGALAGDLLWMPMGRRQHVAVWTGVGRVEAHAGLRRVVERPGPAEGSAWRFPE